MAKINFVNDKSLDKAGFLLNTTVAGGQSRMQDAQIPKRLWISWFIFTMLIIHEENRFVYPQMTQFLKRLQE